MTAPHPSLFITLIAALWLTLLSGCSVFMAANQPTMKNIELFQTGTPRNQLLAEFGAPFISEVRDGKKVEMFRFIQGYRTVTRTSRAVFHGLASVVTLGLWEVIATPTEGIFKGDEVVFEVTYDDEDRVEHFVALKKK